MVILYRIISIFINFIALMFAISLVMSLPVLLSSPLNLLSSFIIVSIVLYSWFSYKFSRSVLQLKQPVKPNLRDWIRVNGIVAIIYCIMVIIAVSFLLIMPQIFTELIKSMPGDLPIAEADLKKVFIVMLVYAIMLLTHVILTFILMKKHHAVFTAIKENP